MRIVNRLLFAIMAGIGLMLVVLITSEYYKSRAMITELNKRLEEENYTDLISVRYYNETPIFEETIVADGRTLLVLIYEAANISIFSKEYVILDGFQFLMIQKDGPSFPDHFTVKVNADTDVEVEYLGVNLYQTGIYTALYQETSGTLFYRSYYTKENQFQTIRKITFAEENETLFELDVELKEENLTLKPLLQGYIDEHQNPPNQAIAGVNYNQQITIDDRGLAVRNGLIYLVIIITLYVLIFVRKRKTLGREKVSEALQKDIDRIRKSD